MTPQASAAMPSPIGSGARVVVRVKSVPTKSPASLVRLRVSVIWSPAAIDMLLTADDPPVPAEKSKGAALLKASPLLISPPVRTTPFFASSQWLPRSMSRPIHTLPVMFTVPVSGLVQR